MHSPGNTVQQNPRGNRRGSAILPILLLTMFGVSAGAQAQEYPSRPITLDIPYGVGGSADVGGRVVAQSLSGHFAWGSVAWFVGVLASVGAVGWAVRGLPVAPCKATTESEYRLSPLRLLGSKSGRGLPTPQYNVSVKGS